MRDLTRYKVQFEALLEKIEALHERYKDHEEELGGRQKTILQLLEGLRLFATGQFDFFYNGFNGGGGKYPPLREEVEPNGKIQFPAEQVLANTIAQVSADITTVQLAAEYRRLASKGQRETLIKDGKAYDKLLGQADFLAHEALWPPVMDSKGDWEIKTVLTYPTDSVRVRVMPYSQVALLGVPYTFLKDLRSYLAIPHEIGHFLFWYSQKQGSGQLLNVRESRYPFNATQNPLPWRIDEDGTDGKIIDHKKVLYFSNKEHPWSEEIFADTYGVLMGGPLSILTAMDLALEYSVGAFREFRGSMKHPTPLIRPMLMIKALKQLTKRTPQGGPPLLNVDSEPTPAQVVLELCNIWKRKLEDKGIMMYVGEPALHESTGQKFDFIKPEIKKEADPTGTEEIDIAKFVGRTMAWDDTANYDVGLNTNFPVELSIELAIKALADIFGRLNLPREGWGWSSHAFGKWKKVEELYADPEGRINEITQNAMLEEPAFTLSGMKDLDRSEPQALWQKWVTKEGKGYFDRIPSSTIWAGSMTM